MNELKEKFDHKIMEGKVERVIYGKIMEQTNENFNRSRMGIPTYWYQRLKKHIHKHEHVKEAKLDSNYVDPCLQEEAPNKADIEKLNELLCDN